MSSSMNVTIEDQRKNQTTAIAVDADLVNAYMDEVNLDQTEPVKLKIRIRDKDHTPYGYMKRTSSGYRVVVICTYTKPALSEAASYVVSNSLRHELRHVAQYQEEAAGGRKFDYNAWAETEAQAYGRQIKGQTDRYAIKS